MFTKSKTIAGSIVSVSLSFSVAHAADKKNERLQEVWSVSENIKNPESAYFDRDSGKIYVSNVSGGATDKDGVGWISIVSIDKDGKPHANKIVEGLNAPKGLRSHKGVLYVTDIDEIVKIDMASNKIIGKIKVSGATFLNDIGIAGDGRVFVSDMLKSQIFVIENDVASIFVSGPEFESPNGLLVVGNELYVASWGYITDPATFGVKTPGHLYSLNLKTKKRSQIGDSTLGNLDGLERTKDGTFIVSDWVAGKVFAVTPKGKATLILDGVKNTADIGLMGKLLLVPSMSTDQVIAFSMK